MLTGLSETLLLLFRGLCTQFQSLLKDLQAVHVSNNTESFLSFREVMQQGVLLERIIVTAEGAACETNSAVLGLYQSALQLATHDVKHEVQHL